jgi:hypothetical protein
VVWASPARPLRAAARRAVTAGSAPATRWPQQLIVDQPGPAGVDAGRDETDGEAQQPPQHRDRATGLSREQLERCSAAAQLLGMQPGDIARAATKQPALLQTPPDVLATHVERLAAALEVTQWAVVLMLCRLGPDLFRSALLMPTPSLRQQLSDLRFVLSDR